MVLYLCVLIVFSLRRESLKLILVMNPSPRWFCHTGEPFLVSDHVSWAIRIYEPLILQAPSITYIEWEKVDGSVLGLVRKILGI
jgi:hypothetical protein